MRLKRSGAPEATPCSLPARCPYGRSLITVVGSNHNLHDRSKGGLAPCCSKTVVSHQIGTEFVIPTHLLED